MASSHLTESGLIIASLHVVGSLLFDNDEPTTYKEAMVGPDSVKWLEAIKSVIVPYTRNQVLNLEDPPERCKNLSVVFGSIKKQTWMFHIYETVDMS